MKDDLHASVNEKYIYPNRAWRRTSTWPAVSTRSALVSYGNVLMDPLWVTRNAFDMAKFLVHVPEAVGLESSADLREGRREHRGHRHIAILCGRRGGHRRYRWRRREDTHRRRRRETLDGAERRREN